MYLKIQLLNIAAIALRSLSFVSADRVMANPVNYKEAKSIFEFNAKDIKGEVVPLEKYKGKVCIIVNVASECGYAKNHYEELNQLYEKYKDQGLAILGFPCNQFGSQEPGDENAICSFVSSKSVKFDMFSKIDVNGDNAHPLWKFLKHKQGGTLIDAIKWNFTKFIVNREGQPVERHGPSTSPKQLEDNIKHYLNNGHNEL